MENADSVIALDAIQSFHANNPSSCRTATAHDVVLNSECCYTFHNPYTTPAGIVVHLMTWIGTCQELAFRTSKELAFRTSKTNDPALFVRIVKERRRKRFLAVAVSEAESTSNGAPAAPTKLGIGVEGGFASDEDKYETLSTYSVVLLQMAPSNQSTSTTVLAEIPYNDLTKAALPDALCKSVDSVIQHVGISTQEDVQVWQLDQEDIPVSKYAATLPFVDNGVMIDPNPAAWKCQMTGATENLWLNLSDGYIGGGRRHWDGSGGSNGALDHFEDTGRQYPLVVKLGTITSHLDTADCYSYAPDEDGPVKIPNIADLLSKRGIRVADMQKTVKSTAELEVELNANYAFDAITESGSKLVPVTGPGLQGLQNLGNSCYMNSVLQLLLSGTVVELAKRYGTDSSSSLVQHPLQLNASSSEAARIDILCQTVKVAYALTSGLFCKPLSDDADVATEIDSNPKYRLAPRMFKHAIGKDHVDFRTAQQQDAAQFLQYLLERLDRAELGAQSVCQAALKSTDGDGKVHVASNLFSFRTTERLVCNADNKVKYKENVADTMWSVRIPMDKTFVVTRDEAVTIPEQKRLKSDDHDGSTTTMDVMDEPVAAESTKGISFLTCVEEWARESVVDGLQWDHLHGARYAARQQIRFGTFPRYLLVQIQRYQLGTDWTPIKLQVELDIPQELDLEPFRSTGPQDGESLIPNDEDTGHGGSLKPAPTAIDETALTQLMDMGFSINSSKRALSAVGGSDVEAAMGWVFEHNNDHDFNDPLLEVNDGHGEAMDANVSSPVGDGGVDEGVVFSLVESLGCFSPDHVRAALKITQGAADRAADWLFSHMDDLDGAIAGATNVLSSASNSSGSANTSVKPSVTPGIALDDGKGKYSMIGMISHIGKHTASGHYVAHIKKDGKWVIFNDEKVALSSDPPFGHAYMYLFQRSDTIGVPHSKY